MRIHLVSKERSTSHDTCTSTIVAICLRTHLIHPILPISTASHSARIYADFCMWLINACEIVLASDYLSIFAWFPFAGQRARSIYVATSVVLLHISDIYLHFFSLLSLFYTKYIYLHWLSICLLRRPFPRWSIAVFLRLAIGQVDRFLFHSIDSCRRSRQMDCSRHGNGCPFDAWNR
jgi:hypothetical protein